LKIEQQNPTSRNAKNTFELLLLLLKSFSFGTQSEIMPVSPIEKISAQYIVSLFEFCIFQLSKYFFPSQFLVLE